MDCSPGGLSMGFSRQEFAISSSRGSLQPRDGTQVFCLLHWQVVSLPLQHLGGGKWYCYHPTDPLNSLSPFFFSFKWNVTLPWENCGRCLGAERNTSHHCLTKHPVLSNYESCYLLKYEGKGYINKVGQIRCFCVRAKGNDWRRQWHPTPVLLPGKSHGRRSLVGCSPWGHWGLDTTERLHFQFSLSCIGEGNGNPLQCSCLEIPGTGSLVGCHLWGRTESDTTEAT